MEIDVPKYDMNIGLQLLASDFFDKGILFKERNESE